VTVPTATVARYQNMVLRLGTTEPYLVPIPLEDKLPLKPQIDPSVKPPQIVKGKHGPVEWVGSGLDAITEVTIAQPSTTAGAPPASVPQPFSVYASGTRLLVHLATGIDAPGKVTLECTTAADDKLTLTLFVVEA